METPCEDISLNVSVRAENMAVAGKKENKTQIWLEQDPLSPQSERYALQCHRGLCRITVLYPPSGPAAAPVLEKGDAGGVLSIQGTPGTPGGCSMSAQKKIHHDLC